ncbi:TIR domain-containing protein [Pseudomonas sp. NPDC098740]|uniref:TIR domain-containing protein n=1 Tax=Pseudomonas sp. NPDC098740 TaxID=3364486 RepID=UPI00383A33D3
MTDFSDPSLCSSFKIFVSYTTRDAIINRDSLACFLRPISTFGKPFIDLIHNNSKYRQARVEAELKSSNLLLLLETKSTKQSQWVQWEIKTAEAYGIPVKAIKIGNAIPSEQQIINAIQSYKTETRSQPSVVL